MRIYDPADCIRYVHLAQQPADDDCQQLPAGYANASPGTRLPGTRPALVLLPGGSAGTPALRLAR